MKNTNHDERDKCIIELMTINPEAGESAEGYEYVTDPEELSRLGLTPEMLVDEENGFKARVFKDAEGHYVVMFEGTDFTDPEQRDMLQENLPGGVGTGPQSEMAMDIAQAIGHSGMQDQVIYAGHSLGGRLASVAAMTSGSPAITANAAGVSDSQMRYIAESNGMSYEELKDQVDGGLVRVYQTSDDILTFIQEDVPGISNVMPDAAGSPIKIGKDPTPTISGHGSDNVWKWYKDLYK